MCSVKFHGNMPLKLVHVPLLVHWLISAIFLFSYQDLKEHSPDDFNMSGTFSATLVPHVSVLLPVSHLREWVLNEIV